MKPSDEFHHELRQRILSLPGVTEWENAGIHEDVFFRWIENVHAHS